MLPGQDIAVNDHALQAADVEVSLYTTNASFIVGQPLLATVPNIVLATSASTVGLCDGLVLDGSASSGSGGRDLTFNFSVSPGKGFTESAVQNISKVLEKANKARNKNGLVKVRLARDAMVPGPRAYSTTTTPPPRHFDYDDYDD